LKLIHTPKGGHKIFYLFTILFFSCGQATALEIKLKKENWGNVSSEEIKKVLSFTAKQFVPCSPLLKEAKIEVSRTQSSPIVLHARGKEGTYQVKLNTRERFWTQYAFQFAHELGHIICGYQKGYDGNQWFEECLCEVASLYCLKSISKTWAQKPPYPRWQNYAKEFSKYANARIRDAKIPENFSLPNWWRNNRKALSQNQGMRRQYIWVATKLLPLFQTNPVIAWSACKWLNHKKSNSVRSFRKSLQDWKNSCPDQKYEDFVTQVAKLFEVYLS